jgi:hypothetical protein
MRDAVFACASEVEECLCVFVCALPYAEVSAPYSNKENPHLIDSLKLPGYVL